MDSTHFSLRIQSPRSQRPPFPSSSPLNSAMPPPPPPPINLLPTVVVLLLLLPFRLTTAVGIDTGPGFGVWIGGGGGSGASPPSEPTPSSPSPGASLAGAYTALQAWKSSITEDPKGILTTWVGPSVCSSYKGIFCSSPPEDLAPSPSQVVAVIDLNHFNLKGTLAEELSLLTHLSALHLNSNRFSGSVPFSLANLQYLQELDLSNNAFTGPFPTPVLSIPNLVYLDLRYNRFAGDVPEELFERDLDAVFLNNNMFTGQIPGSLWRSQASVINLANNRFTGSLLPPGVGSIGMGNGVRELLFLNNRLTGCIPDGLGWLANIEVLDFSYNSFYGQLPPSLSCLSEMEVFNIAHNQLSGDASDVLCSLRSLLNLTVSFNFFSGFSHDCTSLFFRNIGFDISGNCIQGRVLQRPQPECSTFPRTVSSCSPSIAAPLVCRIPILAEQRTNVSSSRGKLSRP